MARQLTRAVHAGTRVELHIDSAVAINELLAEPFDGPTIVMTHHAPSPRSIARRYQGNGLNPAFCSDLNDLILRHRPTAWVHGHMHSSANYRSGARVCSTIHVATGNENAGGFYPALILDTDDG